MVRELKNTEGVGVSLCCATLETSRSGYYDWLKRPESKRDQDNFTLLERIKAIYDQSDKTYGSPRVTAQLRSEGHECGENRVARLMRENNIASEAVKKFKVQTADSNHELPIADRIFETENADAVMASNLVWTGDIMYVHTEEGWLYLAVFLDIFTRKIVGFSSADQFSDDLVMEALAMALGRQEVNEGELITHTDRGSQYASDDYRRKLTSFNIVASMSRKGNCYDNAHVESFFHTLKTELVFRKKFKTREEAKQVIFEWIETWYNKKSIHSSLEYMSPNDYERLAMAA